MLTWILIAAVLGSPAPTPPPERPRVERREPAGQPFGSPPLPHRRPFPKECHA